MSKKIVVFEVTTNGEKARAKALSALAAVLGVESISADRKDNTLTVVGTMDPVDTAVKLRKLCYAEMISLNPVKMPGTRGQIKKAIFSEMMSALGETSQKQRNKEVASSTLEEKKEADKKLPKSTMRPGKSNKDKNYLYTNNVTTFSYFDLQQATSYFSESSKLGQGGFGKVYKGNLRGNEVAIKILLSPGDSHQVKAFNQEIDILCKLNHPHLVHLIGACPQKYALVYEFVPGGTLEARLVSNDLPWQDRIHIATEICYALMFLHSLKPNFIVHGDLKPENVLLDANGKIKLGDFGICRRIPVSNTTTTAHCTTVNVQGSAGYLDPMFLQSGRLTPSVDVYAFGMVLLRLLTNKKAGYELIEKVEDAMSQQCLDKVLDTATNWPSDLAEELAGLATRCCHYRPRERPKLVDEVCKKLKQMKQSLG